MRTPTKELSVLVFAGLLLPLCSALAGSITGTIRCNNDGDLISGARIVLQSTSIGAVSGTDGTYTVSNVSDGRYVLVTSAPGYRKRTDTVIVSQSSTVRLDIALDEIESETDDIVVTGTRTPQNILTVPVRVEAVGREEIEEKMMMRPANIAMLLSEMPGLRVQTTSAFANSANIRIQGLDGRYSQVLVDGVPSFTGMVGGFGLMQMVPLNLTQVEVVKGASSALYGADAISGIINFITKTPTNEELEVSGIINRTTLKGTDVSVYGQQKIDNLAWSVLASTNYQSFFDVENDGVSNLPVTDRITVTPKLSYRFGDNVETTVSLGYMDESRRGQGVLSVPTPIPSTVSVIDDHSFTRFNAMNEVRISLDEVHSLSFKASAMVMDRNSRVDSALFKANQFLGYGEVQYTQVHEDHDFVVGLAWQVENFTDASPGFQDRSYEFFSPGIFIQDELHVAPWMHVTGSLRLDIHNIFGTIATPRLSTLFNVGSEVTTRIAYGRGWKAPTIFMEQAEEIGFYNTRIASNIRRETAWHASWDATWKKSVADEVSVQLIGAIGLTRLANSLAFRSVGGSGLIGNSDETLSSNTAEVNTVLQAFDVRWSLSYAYTDARLGQLPLPLNPKHWIGTVLMYESENLGLRIGWEAYYNGKQVLERSERPGRTSAEFVLMGLLIEKNWGAVSTFINFENILDARQTRYDALFSISTSGTISRNDIFAPLEGRVINGGIRFAL